MCERQYLGLQHHHLRCCTPLCRFSLTSISWKMKLRGTKINIVTKQHVMQSRSIRRSGQPTSASASRMRAFDRDLIRGGHYGQRSCEPHQKAEHMAAPTKSAT